ncbi:MAG TPA: type II secretion system F family protein [Paraburkholderia sp.]|nr:type II secretion system F family protein [Paraburkholderia sp.]
MNALLILAIAFAGATLLIWLILRTGTQVRMAGLNRVASKVNRSPVNMPMVPGGYKVAMWTLLALAALPIAGFVLSGSMLFAAVISPFALTVPKKAVARMHATRLVSIEKQLPDALLMMAGALRAGASFPIALESVARESLPPVSEEFDLLMRELRLGIDLEVAMRNVEKRIPIRDFMMVTAAITIAREVGGNLAEALESVARTLREKLQMEGKIRALTSQGHMQGIVMTCLPLLLMVVLRFIEPVAMAPLFSEPVGWATLGVIATMEFLGYQSISKITRIDV